MQPETYWLIRWRFAWIRAWGFPGDRTGALTVDTVAQLRDLIARARRSPDIASYKHWRVREWCGPVPTHHCHGEGTSWGLNTRPCLCGIDHRIFDCGACQVMVEYPEPGPECGTIPWPGMRRQAGGSTSAT